MAQPKTSKRKRPEEKEKEELVGLLAKEFREAPEDMWAWFPEIAAKLDKLLTPKRPASNSESLHYSYLGERERDFRLKTLASIIETSKDTDITQEEAVEALENAAALREQAEPYKDAVLTLLGKALQFPLDHAEAKTMHFQKGKPEHHTYALARGITLSLTWDRKLIKITFDPMEFSVRRKALSFVGVASDKDRDVARRHDFYLENAFGH